MSKPSLRQRHERIIRGHVFSAAYEARREGRIVTGRSLVASAHARATDAGLCDDVQMIRRMLKRGDLELVGAWSGAHVLDATIEMPSHVFERRRLGLSRAALRDKRRPV